MKVQGELKVNFYNFCEKISWCTTPTAKPPPSPLGTPADATPAGSLKVIQPAVELQLVRASSLKYNLELYLEPATCGCVVLPSSTTLSCTPQVQPIVVLRT